MKRALFFAFLSCLLLPCGAAAAPTMRDVLVASYAIRGLDDVDLAASGQAVVWSEGYHDPRHLLDSPRSVAVYLQHLGSGRRVQVTAERGAGNYDEEEPVWSPDGRRVAFLSDARSSGQMQIYLARADGSGVRQLGRLNGNVQRLTWSPDGRDVAVLYIEAAHRRAGALAAGARDVGVIGSTVDEQRIALLDARSGAVRLITPGDSYVYEYGWSPDGRQIAATYAKGNGDDNWWVARLATVDVAGGAMHDLFAPAFQLDDPQWSPDGSQIAVIGGVMSDFGSTGGDLYLVNPSTGAARDATPNAAFSVESLRWNDAASVDLVAHVSGSMALMRLDVASGQTSQVVPPRAESLWSWSSAKGGSVVALMRQSFDDPPELWAGAPGALAQITHRNAGAKRLYGKAVSLQWTSDGFTVTGWLVYPLDFDPHRTYPMVTMIHGGPSAQSVPVFGSRNLSGLASQGYFVFMPNPRGSFGEGEAFTKANVKDFGYGDWRDDLRGVDAALAAAPIDPNRLGLMGWSYGGYIAMWAETQTTRFKALVAGAGIVNWQSYYGQNKIDQWMIPFFGASVYDDPAVYARSSPITFVLHSKTPVLILQGERDEEVPAPQAFEFWHAMTTLGVPTKLVVYADEGHGPRKIGNQIDVLEQTLNWFDRYLPPVTP
ncbi:MAG TPA: S9 family peptidase [Candidatus Cybelea sp.]|jgi:dipeptidyl aminopeptidase/acylaminoacyl peptidase|nr:S9 family peptidase [Candidatus Cybelea sp.]